MSTTRYVLHFAGFFLLMPVVAFAANAATKRGDSGFKGPLGLQLYSLREQFAKDVPGTLDKVRDMGFVNVELATTYGQPTEKFKAELDARGLKAISAHYPFEKFRDDVDGIVKDAKVLGLKYAGTAGIPHKGDFTEKDCRNAIKVFNKAGATLAKNGIKFFYHTHGFEFQPYGSGTLFDLLVTETKPKLVSYEMDVFWVVHGGQNPVSLFEKYGKRFELVHLKDMKIGTPINLLTGHSDVRNDVAMGTGRIDYRRVLPAAEKAGVKWYFIEDESPTSEKQIPQTMRYLKEVTW
jgi:sugar phosphate isomerase/epimerase